MYTVVRGAQLPGSLSVLVIRDGHAVVPCELPMTTSVGGTCEGLA